MGHCERLAEILYMHMCHFLEKGQLGFSKTEMGPPSRPRITALEGPRVPLTAVGPLLECCHRKQGHPHSAGHPGGLD